MSSSSSYNHQDFIKKHLIPSITKNKTCSICLNNNISNPSLIPSCLHAYCTDCILKWSEFKRECPLCKAKFTSLFVDIDVESVTYRTLHLSKDVKGPTNNVGGGDEGYIVGYSASNRAYRVYNVPNKRVEETESEVHKMLIQTQNVMNKSSLSLFIHHNTHSRAEPKILLVIKLMISSWIRAEGNFSTGACKAEGQEQRATLIQQMLRTSEESTVQKNSSSYCENEKQVEPRSVAQALEDPSWVDAMQEEMQ
ncbi:E3 ubiquitin protein ligase Topors [Tanacetum coccineum]